MRIALAQINSTISDFAGNLQCIFDTMHSAQAGGADLLLFPELAICGYPPMDLLDRNDFLEQNLRALDRVRAATTETMAVVIGHLDATPQPARKRLQNVVSVLHDGRFIHRQAKTLLPTYDVFDEARYFQPADRRTLFQFRGLRIGIAICEDVLSHARMAAEAVYDAESTNGLPPAPQSGMASQPGMASQSDLPDPVDELIAQGCDLILAPSASPFYSGKPYQRLRILTRIARAVPVVYVNCVGAHDDIIFDGNSMLLGAQGVLLHRSPAFRPDVAIIDPEAATPVTTDPVTADMSTDMSSIGHWDAIVQALMLGISDYVRKTGFKRVHLGLSGGIDSAVVATLAVRALGPQRVVALRMPSPYSTPTSRSDAEDLARRLGIHTHCIAIDDLFTAFGQALQPIFGNRPPDTTEENIQARIRGVLLMAYSNKFHSLTLATGNKSELATGYCTLYGDMVGGLAVIGDLFKSEVYAVARHLNRTHVPNSAPIPQAILDKAPSAELRHNQKDSDSLPPYPDLDRVLEQYLLYDYTASEIIAQGLDANLVQRVINMVEAAEYKRRQAPLVLKVSQRAFGAGRRIPIARVI